MAVACGQADSGLARDDTDPAGCWRRRVIAEPLVVLPRLIRSPSGRRRRLRTLVEFGRRLTFPPASPRWADPIAAYVRSAALGIDQTPPVACDVELDRVALGDDLTFAPPGKPARPASTASCACPWRAVRPPAERPS